MNYSIDKFKGKLDQERLEPSIRGLDLGFELLHKIFTWVIGRPFIVYGYPGHGKTEVCFEFLIQLSIIHNKQHFILSPETGNGEARDVVRELISKYGGKNWKKMTQAEYENAFSWVREYFYVVDPNNELKTDYTLQDVYDLCDQIERDSHWRFSTVMVDTWKELNNGGVPVFQHVENIIKGSRNQDHKQKRTTLITVHAKDDRPLFDKGTHKKWLPIPTPSNMNGGTNWWYLGYSILCVYRPDTDVIPDTAYNESWLIFQKVKPKEAGKAGMVKWFYDLDKGRFYEKINGHTTYGQGSKLNHNIKPNNNLDETWENQNSPF